MPAEVDDQKQPVENEAAELGNQHQDALNQDAKAGCSLFFVRNQIAETGYWVRMRVVDLKVYVPQELDCHSPTVLVDRLVGVLLDESLIRRQTG